MRKFFPRTAVCRLDQPATQRLSPSGFILVEELNLEKGISNISSTEWESGQWLPSHCKWNHCSFSEVVYKWGRYLAVPQHLKVEHWHLYQPHNLKLCTCGALVTRLPFSLRFFLYHKKYATTTECRKPLKNGARNGHFLAPFPDYVHWQSREAENTMVPRTNVMFSDSREQKDCQQQWRLMYGFARGLRCASSLMPLLSCWSASGVQRKRRISYMQASSPCSYSMPLHCQLLAWHAYSSIYIVL